MKSPPLPAESVPVLDLSQKIPRQHRVYRFALQPLCRERQWQSHSFRLIGRPLLWQSAQWHQLLVQFITDGQATINRLSPPDASRRPE